MGKYLRKTEGSKRPRQKEGKHWLGEGTNGQEVLLEQIDPILFAVDKGISSQAVSLAHRLDRTEEGPFAVVILPESSMCWQISYLARHYNTYVWSPDADDLLDRAVGHFGGMLLEDDIFHEIEHEVQFLVHADYAWPSEQALREDIQSSFELLSEDGLSAFILTSTVRHSQEVLVWTDGTETLLSEALRTLRPTEVVSVGIGECCAQMQAVVSDFLKRNRVFFGKDARGIFLERMAEADFRDVFHRESARRVHLFCFDRSTYQ